MHGRFPPALMGHREQDRHAQKPAAWQPLPVRWHAAFSAGSAPCSDEAESQAWLFPETHCQAGGRNCMPRSYSPSSVSSGCGHWPLTRSGPTLGTAREDDQGWLRVTPREAPGVLQNGGVGRPQPGRSADLGDACRGAQALRVASQLSLGDEQPVFSQMGSLCPGACVIRPSGCRGTWEPVVLTVWFDWVSDCPTPRLCLVVWSHLRTPQGFQVPGPR